MRKINLHIPSSKASACFRRLGLWSQLVILNFSHFNRVVCLSVSTGIDWELIPDEPHLLMDGWIRCWSHRVGLLCDSQIATLWTCPCVSQSELPLASHSLSIEPAILEFWVKKYLFKNHKQRPERSPRPLRSSSIFKVVLHNKHIDQRMIPKTGSAVLEM